MLDRKHPVWFIVFFALVLVAGLTYCGLAFHNGVDLPKDTTLIGIVTGLTAAWFKFTNSGTTP